MSELSELDLSECQIANALQPPSAVDVLSPKKAKADEEKQKCCSTANTQATKTFLVWDIGKHVCRFILSDSLLILSVILSFCDLFVRVIFFLNLRAI